MIILDLDGVVIDTVRLVQDFKALLVRNGLSKIKVDDFYLAGESPAKYMSRTYYLLREPHIMRKLFEASDDQIARTKEAVVQFLNLFPNYVFDDARLFLNEFSDLGIMLLSYGGLDWQNLKIDKAGLRGCFKKIIITHGAKKVDALRQFFLESSLESTSTIFVDDRGKEISLMKEEIPGVTTFLMIRPNGKFNHEPCFTYNHKVSDLQEVAQFLQMNQSYCT